MILMTNFKKTSGTPSPVLEDTSKYSKPFWRVQWKLRDKGWTMEGRWMRDGGWMEGGWTMDYGWTLDG
jgi:hypothetical protein